MERKPVNRAAKTLMLQFCAALSSDLLKGCMIISSTASLGFTQPFREKFSLQSSLKLCPDSIFLSAAKPHNDAGQWVTLTQWDRRNHFLLKVYLSTGLWKCSNRILSSGRRTLASLAAAADSRSESDPELGRSLRSSIVIDSSLGRQIKSRSPWRR